MDKIIFQRLKIEAPLFWKLFLGLGFFILVGYLCAHEWQLGILARIVYYGFAFCPSETLLFTKVIVHLSYCSQLFFVPRKGIVHGSSFARKLLITKVVVHEN